MTEEAEWRKDIFVREMQVVPAEYQPLHSRILSCLPWVTESWCRTPVSARFTCFLTGPKSGDITAGLYSKSILTNDQNDEADEDR